MSAEALPHRAKPSLLHEICRFIRGKGEVSKSEVYNSIDENQKTLRRTLIYGVTLGFLEQDGERYTLTNRGSGISYISSFEGQEPVIDAFREGIEDFGPYRDAILRVFDGDLMTEGKEGSVVEQDTFREVLRESVDEEVDDREVNVIIKTAEAAGLGEYKAGRRGYQTRLVLNDSFEMFADELLDKYPLPKESKKENQRDPTQNSDKKLSEVEQDTLDIESSASVTLTVELDVSGKSEEEIARIIQKIRNDQI